MHIHILGACGTFMGGVALLAQARGARVTGCDANVYPPMSTQLAAAGVELIEGYDAAQLELKPDVYVIGNAVSRGNPLLEAILDAGLGYTSGPQWLAEHVLAGKWVLAVAGTHGKTTTASMLAWILEDAGLDPGFLIGGVPLDFGRSARLTDGPFFVVEADEYDTAFFDKRSKFVHYRPRTAVLNNLEFDHADNFADLAAIQTQFHHLVRTVPGNGRVIADGSEASLRRVLARGVWTPVEELGTEAGWRATEHADGADIWFGPERLGRLVWDIPGRHNLHNALAALAAARHAGVPVDVGLEALGRFRGVKRRLEVRGTAGGVTVFDDFAHHPTAIRLTLEGLRRQDGAAPVFAVLEPRSNTMRMGVHRDTLADSLQGADRVYCYAPSSLGWDARAALAPLGARAAAFEDLEALSDAVVADAAPGTRVLVMSNGGFGGVHEKLLRRLAARDAGGTGA